MSLTSLLVLLVLAGVVLWLVNNTISMDAVVRKIINVVVLLVVIIYVLVAFGVLGEMNSVRVPRVGG